MKEFLKSLFRLIQLPADFFLSIIIIPAAYLLWAYRRVGARRLPKTTYRLKKIGVFPILNHYFEPLFDDKLLARPLDEDRDLPGLNLNVANQLRLLKELKFSDELLDLNLTNKSDSVEAFHMDNGSFDSGDAEFLYQFIRHTKPRKIIEIGSGSSTKIARLALKRNESESGIACQHICVEPYEQPWLEALEGITVVRELVENCRFDWANELESGDILFVDSSHIIRPQGDVLKEYLEIFPQLKPGVFVHIHDIFTPKDYPKSWIVDNVSFWNEQYLLEALLTNSNKFEIFAALNFLKHNYFKELADICPYLSSDREPGSFYLKVKS